MTTVEEFDVRWEIADRGRSMSVLDGTVYMTEGDDVVGYDLDTGSGEVRISDVGMEELTVAPGQRLLFGRTDDSVVAVDPRTERVRWENEPLRDGADGRGCLSLTATDSELYALCEEDVSAPDEDYVPRLILFRFHDFSSNVGRDFIYNGQDHEQRYPPRSVGKIRTVDGWAYTFVNGSESDHLFGLHSAGNNWEVTLDHPPESFDVSSGTVYVLSNPQDEQPFLTAFDATTGASLWETPVPDASTVVAGTDAAVLGGQEGLVTVDGATGSIRWEDYVHDADGELVITDGMVYANRTDSRTGRLSVFDFDDGSLLYETELEPFGLDGSLTVLEDGVVCTTANSLVCLDRPATSDDPDISDTATDNNTSGPFCPNCGSAVSDDAKFCSECGTGLAASECSGCGTELDGDEAFCPQCGTALED